MGNIRIKTNIEVVDTEGSRNNYHYVYNNTTLNEYYSHILSISASETIVVWDPTSWANFNISDFDTMCLISDGNLDIELTTNEGDSNEELFTLRLVDGLPLFLGADDSYYNHSASDAYGGTLDVIDKIRAKEPEGSSKKLHILLIT